MNYRDLGNYKSLASGVWPDVELVDAKAKRDKARRVLAQGIDPFDQMKLEGFAAIVAAANIFKAVVDEWYVNDEKEGLPPATLNKIRWLLDYAYRSFGNRPIEEILPHELLALLRKFEARKSADLRGALISVKVIQRAAITTPTEVGAALRAINTFEGNSVTLAHSSCCKRFALSSSRPPNLALHLQNVALLIEFCRQRSAVGSLASCSFDIPMICSSLNLLRVIV